MVSSGSCHCCQFKFFDVVHSFIIVCSAWFRSLGCDSTFITQHKEISGLKFLDPSADKHISVFAHDAEVRALQFVHERLSIRTLRVLHHAMSSSILGTGRKASGISSWRNAQACLSLRLSVACPPPNSTISLISCSSFPTRCAHTHYWCSKMRVEGSKGKACSGTSGCSTLTTTSTAT